jgi:taurine dioxygenase
MTAIEVTPLSNDLSFGARIRGVKKATLKSPDACAQIRAVFEDKALIVFEDVEPSALMQIELSNVFGPLKEHPVAAQETVDAEHMPGVIDMGHNPNDPGIGIVEIQGKQLSCWLPWHFDHCYNNELNRAGVLRALKIPREGGMTGFIDGIQLYNDFSPELRRQIEGHYVIYTLDLAYARMRFGRPESFREIQVQTGVFEACEQAKTMPRALHPAVWTTSAGKKVLHVSPWMAVGIQNHEDAEGNALLEAVCKEIEEKAMPYFHKWAPTDMLIWDNWRMLHRASGHDPREARRMHRTTIKGDYGLGAFEGNRQGGKILEMDV